MSQALGTLYVDILCGNCGFTSGKPVGENLNRCCDCGRFATDDPDVCCLRHKVGRSPYPTGECPMCEEERNIQAQREHMVTRDPMVEPW